MKEIILYRTIGISRLKWKFVVDDFDNIIFEGPADTVVEPMADPSSKEARQAAIEQQRIRLLAQENSQKTAQPQLDVAKLAANNGLTQGHFDLLDKRGIKYEKLEGGRVQIISIPAKESIISAFIKVPDSQCHPSIPNCQALQARMNSEIETAGGDRCPQCELNKIKNKYREMLESTLPADVK